MTLARPQKERSDKFKAAISSNEIDLTAYISFSFKYLTDHTNHHINACGVEGKDAFLERMHRLSSMTWNEIYTTHRHSFGSEKIPQNIIRVQLPNIVTKEVSLIALRYHNNAPMVGFRRDSTFYIIWFDPNLSLYDHG